MSSTTTSNTICVGKRLHPAENVHLDVGRLVKTRALVTANSGGGKSWLLRRLFEQLGQSTQLLVLDREGEFVSLREKLDVVLVGPQGEIPTDLRSAGLLVRRLMEKELSAVVDMSELPLGQQRKYVRLFLEALLGLPKNLWRPCFVGIDEAHLFVPERGSGEAESSEAVINLCTLGRKRGFSAVLATQRISKFHKDAAAELLNKFIGRTTLDVDQKRASDELGLDRREAVPLLRELSPIGGEGEFFAYGPALLTTGVVRLKAGKVHTTHPEPGQGRPPTPPKPSSAILAVLDELKDLPQQAEEEARDVLALQTRIRDLEHKLKNTLPVYQLHAGNPEDAKTIKTFRAALENAMTVIKRFDGYKTTAILADPEEVRKAIEVAVAHVMKAVNAEATKKAEAYEQLRGEAQKAVRLIQPLLELEPACFTAGEVPSPRMSITPARKEAKPKAAPVEWMTAPRQKILDAVWVLETRKIPANRDCIARWLGLHPQGGTFGGNLGWLRAEGYLVGYELTDKGRAAADQAQETGSDKAFEACDNEGQRRILRVLVEAVSKTAARALTRDELAEALGLHPAGGTFGGNIGWLRTMGLITPKGLMTLTPGFWA